MADHYRCSSLKLADRFQAHQRQFWPPGRDRVLKALADVIRHCLRRSDSGFRYGGEFVILMPETAWSSALSLAERLRSVFGSQVIQTAAGEEIRCTVSIGVTEWVANLTLKINYPARGCRLLSSQGTWQELRCCGQAQRLIFAVG